jgi:hypothetical protein
LAIRHWQIYKVILPVFTMRKIGYFREFIGCLRNKIFVYQRVWYNKGLYYIRNNKFMKIQLILASTEIPRLTNPIDIWTGDFYVHEEEVRSYQKNTAAKLLAQLDEMIERIPKTKLLEQLNKDDYD